MTSVVEDSISHQEQYRLNEVISRVLSDKGRRRWSSVFFTLFFAITVMMLGANRETESVAPQERAPTAPVLMVDDFYYAGVEEYPTCKLSKGFKFPGDGSSDLSDYIFLSDMSYKEPAVTKYTLEQWFGAGMVVDEDEFVTQFRTDSNTASSPLYF